MSFDSSLVWAFAAAVLAVWLEVVYRTSDHWPLWCAGPALALTICIYYTIHGGPSFLVAVVGFSLFTLVLRMGVSQFMLGEPVIRGNLVAAVLLLGATVVGRLWR